MFTVIYIYVHTHIYIYVCVCVCVCVCETLKPILTVFYWLSCIQLFCDPHGLQPAWILCPLDFPSKTTGVGCHFLLHEIFPTWVQNPCPSPAFTNRFFTTEPPEKPLKQFQFSSVAQSCPTLCDPMNCSTPGLLSITNSSSLKLTSIESVMPSSHLILCHPLLLLPPIPPSSRVFSNESTLHMRWPKYWSFSFSIIPSKKHPGLISIRMDWLFLQVDIFLRN